MKLQARLLTGFFVVSALGLAVGGTGVTSLVSIGRAADESYRAGTSALATLIPLAEGLGDLRAGLRDCALAPTSEANSSGLALADAGLAKMRQSLKDYQGTVANDADRAQYEAFLTIAETYFADVAQVRDVAATFQPQETAVALQSTAMEDTHKAFLESYEKLVAWNQSFVKTVNAANGTLIAEAIAAMVALAAVAFLVSLVLGLLLARSVVRPLASAVALSRAVADGDLTFRLPEALLVRKDEIGALSHALVSMRQGLADLMAELARAAEDLRTGAQNLASNAEETAASVTEITATIASAKRQVQTQSDSVSAAVVTVGQMVGRLGELEGQIETQTTDVAQSSAAVNQMVANIRSVTSTVEHQESAFRELVAATETGRELVSEMAELTRSIATKGESLDEANLAISAIASQTNLLSMNAAIEAAHAGDTGRGFAVVAEEIRKLADSASVQSRQISADIAAVRGEIAAVVESTGRADAAFGAIMTLTATVNRLVHEIRRAMEEQSQGSQTTLDALVQITGISEAIRTGAQEVAAGSAAVGRQMAELGTLSQELAQGMDEIVVGSRQIDSASQSVSETSVETMQQVEALGRQVARFRVEGLR